MRANKPVLLGLLLTLVLLGIEPRLNHAARLDTDEKTTDGNAAVSTSQPRGTASGTTVHLNFKDADILQIINLMSELTGKNFLVDEKVRGKVTIIAPKPVSLDEAYQVFLSILEIQGFAVVPQGPIIKIVPSREVKGRPLPTTIDGQFQPSSTSDEFVTQLIPLDYAEANEIRGLLTPLVSKQSSMLAYAPTNTLILTDVSSNISRLLKIIRALDIEAPAGTLKVIPLQYASADQMVTSLQSAMEALAQVGSGGNQTPTPATGRRGRQTRRQQAGRQQTTPRRAPSAPRIIADSRTNSLIVIATQSDMATAEGLIAKLDVPTPEGRGQIHVYYLAHASAEELAQVLTAQAAEVARTTTTQEGQQANGQRARRRSPPTSATTPAGITITADKPTNSLVISASPEAYDVLKEIIQKLDIRRSQVLVETLIAEVALSKVQELGVEWRLLDEPNGTQVFASSTGSDATGVLNALTVNPLNPVGGFLIGALRNTITINGQEILNIPAVLRAFQGDTDVNILATPNLLTPDNEEAEIIIGEERPLLRSSQETPSGVVVSTFNTFEFRDTGITLRITPQISQGRTVRLKLFQDINRFLSEAETGAVTTTKRSVKTTVVVDDGQTIVIGGLIQEERDETKTQVPCLGNLPLFGVAFRQTSERKRKTNLLIFITPHIINSPEDIRLITDHKRQQSDKTEDIERQLRENQPQENREILLN
ncbi:MAG: type II secretion system secretin GspD [Candidatus Tectomicrobia bacterium]